MTLRIALTGATGFVGRVVVAGLIAGGYTVRALVRNPSAAALPADIEMIIGDLADKQALAALSKHADVVLHIAGAIKGLTRQDFFNANLEGTKNVFAAAHAAGVKRLVYVSSLAARLPGISSYAASKLAAEEFLLQQQTSMSILILRPAAVYGEGDVATLPLLKALMSRFGILPGQVGSIFSLIHVDDLAAICVDGVSCAATGVHEIDDGHGGYLWGDLTAITQQAFDRPTYHVHLPKFIAMGLGHGCDLIAAMIGKPLPISADKMREIYHTDWTAKGDGWPRTCPVDLSPGLVRTISWYQARGMLPAIKPTGARMAQQ